MQQNHLRFVDPNKSTFQKVLRQRVNNYFKENNISKYANNQMILKTVVLLSLYILPIVYLILFPVSWPAGLFLWAISGFAMAGVGMSVMHDANHESYSKSKSTNNLVSFSLNLLGGYRPNWKLQHNVLHHTYTNIDGFDDDIEDKLILRFSPHTTSKWYHKIQHTYVFLFYGIMTLYWVTAKDFIQYAKYYRSNLNTNKGIDNVYAIARITLLKILYFIGFVGLPIMYAEIPFYQVMTGFMLMHFISGVTLTTTFQLAHTVDGTQHPLPNKEGVIEDNWAIHQMKTTMNFSKKSAFLTWYVGGLNYQVEHHLFPNICHIHYPKIAPIVRSVAKEFNVPYLEHETFTQALSSHIGLMRKIA